MLEENRKIHTRMNTAEDIMLLSYFLVSNCIMVEGGSYQDILKWRVGWGGGVGWVGSGVFSSFSYNN